MKDDESWLFAQNYSNPILKNSSIGMMGLGLLGLLLKLDETYSVILAIIIVLALCLAPIYLTEKALKERFPDKF